MSRILSSGELLQLKRWNTPTIYNGWAQITKQDLAKGCFNLDEVTDFMPGMGPMVGYAITVVIEPSNKKHTETNPNAVSEYRAYMASVPGPKIVVIQDLDKPSCVGAFWGEVNANIHRSLGCIGTITDGAVRDIDEMTNAGFKAIAKRLCIGNAHVTPVKWNCEVEVFGCKIQPGQLIHADKHGFLAVPPEDEAKLLEASVFMDVNECLTIIPAARFTSGKDQDEILSGIKEAGKTFNSEAKRKFSKGGEW